VKRQRPQQQRLHLSLLQNLRRRWQNLRRRWQNLRRRWQNLRRRWQNLRRRWQNLWRRWQNLRRRWQNLRRRWQRRLRPRQRCLRPRPLRLQRPSRAARASGKGTTCSSREACSPQAEADAQTCTYLGGGLRAQGVGGRGQQDHAQSGGAEPL